MSKQKHLQQPTLPFQMEGNTASRKEVRELSVNISDQLLKIDISRIRIRPQFNGRHQDEGLSDDLWEHTLEIPQLADAIYASNGPADPLLGDIHKDGYFYITEGERRYRALRYLITGKTKIYPNGSSIAEVRVLLNPSGTTDLERKRLIATSQNKMPLRPMDRARYYQSFKDEFGMPNERIAELLSLSRQTVDNYILALSFGKEVQAQLNSSELNISQAIADYRKSHKKKMVEVDVETGEVTPESSKKDEKHLDGDEDEFLQQDNTVSSAGSRGGPKEQSGEAIIGKDSIYTFNEDTARWKQFLNRIDQIERLETQNYLDSVVVAGEKDTEWSDEILQDKMIERLRNEYILRVK